MEMKEYLNKTTYEYKRAHCMFGHSEWLEIPDGAEIATKGVGNVNFWKNQDQEFYFNMQGEWSNNCGETLNQYLERNPKVRVIWQRPTQPEALPFIDDNPQSLNEQYAEIEQVRQQSIEATIAQRQSTYGDFEDVAFVTENIMGVLGQVRVNGLSELPNTHRMALYMIASKMARIVNGDFNHIDSWHDIGGYAKLIEDLVKENNNG